MLEIESIQKSNLLLNIEHYMFQVETKFSTLSTKHLYIWNKLKQAS